MEKVTTKQKNPVTIEFTPDECEVLFAACHLISGHPEKSGRRVFDEISKILESEGYERVGKYFNDDRYIDEERINGSINFNV